MNKSRRTISAVLAVVVILALVAMYVRVGLAAGREAGSGLATGRRQYAIVPGLGEVKTVAAYDDNYLALKADGTLWTLGITVNAEGAKSATPGGDLDGDGVPDIAFALQQLKGLDRITAVAAGDGFAAALRSDGTLWVSGIKPAQGPVTGGLDRVKAIAAGPDKVLALKTDGTVWTARIAITESGVKVDKAVPVPELGAAQFATFGPHGEVLAVLGDGSVRVAETADGKTQVSKVEDLQGVRSIAAHADGKDDDCDGIAYAVTADGRVSAMAIKTKGTGAQRVMAGVSSAAGACASGLALKADGTVWTMGFAIGEPGMPGAAVDGGRTIGAGQVADIIAKAVAAGYTWHIAVRPEGSVAVWRAPIHARQVQGLSNVVAVYAAGKGALAQLADGTVADVCNPCSNSQRTFVVPHVLETKGIAIAGDNYYVLHADGTVTAHKVGQAGVGVATGMIPGGSVVSAAISANSTHLFALQSDGTVASIAIDEPGVHVVDGLSDVTAIAAYEGGFLALTAAGKGWDGTIKGRAAQITAVEALDGARAIYCSGKNGWAVMGDGSVRTFAINEQGVHVWGDPHVDERDGAIKVSGGGGGGGSGGAVLLTAAGTPKVSDFGLSRTTAVPELMGVVDVAANSTTAYAVLADGTLWTWPLY